jgi:hypothetical protein
MDSGFALSRAPEMMVLSETPVSMQTAERVDQHENGKRHAE